MWIWISITVCLILLGLLIRKSKLLFLLQCSWIWILTALNNGGWDYDGNEAIYNYSGKNLFSSLSGWANDLFAYFAHQWGWDYVRYNAVLATIGIAILAYVILRFAKRPNMALSLYMIYPMMDSIYQKRFFIAMCFVVLAYSFWIEKKKVPFFVAVLVALGFHFSVFIYLLVPLLDKLVEKNKKKLTYFYLIAEFILLRYSSNLVSYIPFGNLSSKFDEYMSTQQYSSLAIGVMFFVLQLAYIVMIFYIGKYWKLSGEGIDDMDRKIYESNYVAALFLPLLLLGSTYVRYFRVYQIYNFIFLGNRLECAQKRNVLSFQLVYCFVLLLAVASLTIFCAGDMGIESAFSSVYENNVLLGQP